MHLRAWVDAVAIVAVACDGSSGPAGPDGSIEGYRGTTTICGSIADSQITFTFLGQDELVDALREEGCTVTRSDNNFAGTIQGGTLDALFTATIVCEEETTEFSWRILMEKAS